MRKGILHEKEVKCSIYMESYEDGIADVDMDGKSVELLGMLMSAIAVLVKDLPEHVKRPEIKSYINDEINKLIDLAEEGVFE